MFSTMPMTVNIKVDCHENNGKEYSKAEQIPTEILQEILSYLQNPYDPSRLGLQAITRRSIPLVCKAWHDVGMQCLYRRLDFTDDDRPRANLVLRTLEARGDLADYVTALHFPWLIMLDESWTNEQKKLTCYVRIVALCHNLVTLSVPASLHRVLFSSDTLPHVCPPLQPCIADKLASLRIIGDHFIGPKCSLPLSFTPFQRSFSSLRYLELAGLDLTVLESPSNPPFPCLPSLETLRLVDFSVGTTHAKQIITSLKGTLKNLSIRNSSLFCSFIRDALPIIGTSLETFETSELAWLGYCHAYRPDFMEESARPPYREDVDKILPHISVFSVRTNRSGKSILHCLPSSISMLRIDRTCGCSDGGESTSDVVGYDPTVELLDSLTSSQSNFFDIHSSLNAIIFTGKTCSWQNTEAMDRLRLFCGQKGVIVNAMLEGPCTVALLNSRNEVGPRKVAIPNPRRLTSKLRSVPKHTSRAVKLCWDRFVDMFH